MIGFSARATDLPACALLARYADEHYTDCFVTTLNTDCTFSDFVAAFYTTWLFKAERLVLAVVLRRRSTDEDATVLGRGETDRFAVWTVEARAESQLLLCPPDKATRSWLMVDTSTGTTALYFGSALIAATPDTSTQSLGLRLVIRAHRLYSRALLSLARRKLANSVSP